LPPPPGLAIGTPDRSDHRIETPIGLIKAFDHAIEGAASFPGQALDFLRNDARVIILEGEMVLDRRSDLLGEV